MDIENKFLLTKGGRGWGEINYRIGISKCKLLNIKWGFPGGSDGKESACNAKDPGSIPQSGRRLEKGMATHSSILAWKIPR